MDGKNVITYGTFDLFHIGHLHILERCKKLCGREGKLFVAVSSDDFNLKEKNKQCAVPQDERIDIVKAVRHVDEVLLETSWDQKRRDIIDNKIDILVMGDDWTGKFDGLKDICEVVYLPRTEGISTTMLKEKLR